MVGEEGRGMAPVGEGRDDGGRGGRPPARESNRALCLHARRRGGEVSMLPGPGAFVEQPAFDEVR